MINIIIPAHEYIDDLEQTINSVLIQGDNYKPHVVGPQKVIDQIKNIDGITPCVYVDEDTSYAAMVNHCIKRMPDESGDWVSILEYDDELLPNFVETFERYSKSHEADIYSLMSLNLKASDDKTLLGTTNEVTWAGGMAEKQGWYDYNLAIKGHFSFINSMVINRKCFEEFGYFKPSMPMYEDYEWFLRMIYNDVKIYAIPQIRHYHYVRDNSKSMSIANDVSAIERQFWLSTARKEYFFDEDRKIEYEEEG